MMLSGCVASGTNTAPTPSLPRPSPQIQACLNKMVPKPEDMQSMTKEQIMALFVEFRKNDVAKTQCGNRLINQTNNILDEVEAYLRSL